MTSINVGSEFAAPSTASFGDSNEGYVDEANGRAITLAPAVPTGAAGSGQQSASPTMADAIDNAVASIHSTPFSYDVVTMSPMESGPTQGQAVFAEVPTLPNIDSRQGAIQQEEVASASANSATVKNSTPDEMLDALLEQHMEDALRKPQASQNGGNIGPVATASLSRRRENSRPRLTPGAGVETHPLIVKDVSPHGTEVPETPPPRSPRSASIIRSSSKGPQSGEERLPARPSIKDRSREAKREIDRQGADKKRQQEKDARVETLRVQAETSSTGVDDILAECVADTEFFSGGVAAGTRHVGGQDAPMAGVAAESSGSPSS